VITRARSGRPKPAVPGGASQKVVKEGKKRGGQKLKCGKLNQAIEDFTCSYRL